MRKQVEELKHISQLPAQRQNGLVVALFKHPRVRLNGTDLNSAFLIRFQAGEATQKRAFADPGRTLENDDFPFMNIQRKPVDHEMIAVALGQVADLNEGRHVVFAPRLATRGTADSSWQNTTRRSSIPVPGIGTSL